MKNTISSDFTPRSPFLALCGTLIQGGGGREILINYTAESQLTATYFDQDCMCISSFSIREVKQNFLGDERRCADD